jgi:hypothetical protein
LVPALAFTYRLTENSPLPPEPIKPPVQTPPTAEQQARADFDARVDALLAGQNADPFGVLGPHPMQTRQKSAPKDFLRRRGRRISRQRRSREVTKFKDAHTTAKLLRFLILTRFLFF